MKVIKSVFLFGLVLFVQSFYAQSTQYFIQFRILSVADLRTAEMIDSKMKSKTGIVESRTDYITSTYFCLLKVDADYSKEDFENWFTKLGFSISCFTRGIQNTDMMVSPHVLKNCVEEVKQ